MKILATSDWHLGHLLYNFSRDEEQQDMLEQMSALVREHRPDALLISGDVYDTIQPSATVQTMLVDVLMSIHQAHPSMTIVCIAGNHDSGSRHTIYSTPWKALNVHMVGSISRDSDLEDYIIEIDGKGYIAAIPFAADRFMPEGVFDRVQDLIAKRNDKQLPVMLMAHLAVLGSNYRGHDLSTDSNIGGLNCQAIDVLGHGFDFVALGHIHKNQALDKAGSVWYSGTPIAVSFDEVYPGNQHGLMLVECDGHGQGVTTQLLPLVNKHPLVNIPAEGFGSWEDVKEEFKQYPHDISSYIRLNVEVDKYLTTGANDEARLIAADKACRFCFINTKRKESQGAESSTRSFTTSEFKALDPIEVARMWIESRGLSYDDEIDTVLQEVKNDIQINPNREE